MQLNAKTKLLELYDKLLTKECFTFIRFSDGEIEILKNRYCEIRDGYTVFRGRKFKNNFPIYDEKLFDPLLHDDLRMHLLESAFFRGHNFFKGIQTSHVPNGILDRNFLLRLNGGLDQNITFSDLFINSNYTLYLNKILPILSNFNSIFIVANENAIPIGQLSHAKMVPIPSNFFNSYNKVLSECYAALVNAPEGSLILSSASSLSNVLGYKLYEVRKDIFFIDIGTSLNHLLSLSTTSRSYLLKHWSIKHKLFKALERKIKW